MQQMAPSTKSGEVDRQFVVDSWLKFKQQHPLEAIEKRVVAVIEEHPEYHALFDGGEITQNFSNEDPFLHIQFHLVILEQVLTNRPKGITAIYQDFLRSMEDPHHAQHHLMEALADQVEDCLREKRPWDEKAYLKRLKKILKHGCCHEH